MLGGRALKYHFYPLVYPEIKESFDLLKIFNNGLIPQHYSRVNAKQYLESYVDDYLINEVRGVARSSNNAPGLWSPLPHCIILLNRLIFSFRNEDTYL